MYVHVYMCMQVSSIPYTCVVFTFDIRVSIFLSYYFFPLPFLSSFFRSIYMLRAENREREANEKLLAGV